MLRRRYRQRRDALVEAFARALPDWEVLGSAGGLHLTVRLPDGVPEGRLLVAAAGLGLSVFGLGAMTAAANRPAGIVVSYARTTPDMAVEAVNRLVLAVHQLDQITPEMEATALANSVPWSTIPANPAP